MKSNQNQIYKLLLFLLTILISVSGCNTKPQPDTTEHTEQNEAAPMVFIPKGNFTMREINLQGGNLPQTYTVWLDDYYIDTYEVTNSAYKKCVAAGTCPLPSGKFEREVFSREEYYDDPIYKIYPVINVSWNDANTFCEWRGARLPTEAEWVKAARGTDLRIYPWGSDEPTCQKTNYGFSDGACSPSPFLAPIGSHPEGISPYGAYDLSGNVEEWTADCYVELSDFISDGIKNPVAPETSGCKRVIHGGSIFILDLAQLEIDTRNDWSPERSTFATGFRCALSP